MQRKDISEVRRRVAKLTEKRLQKESPKHKRTSKQDPIRGNIEPVKRVRFKEEPTIIDRKPPVKNTVKNTVKEDSDDDIITVMDFAGPEPRIVERITQRELKRRQAERQAKRPEPEPIPVYIPTRASSKPKIVEPFDLWEKEVIDQERAREAQMVSQKLHYWNEEQDRLHKSARINKELETQKRMRQAELDNVIDQKRLENQTQRDMIVGKLNSQHMELQNKADMQRAQYNHEETMAGMYFNDRNRERQTKQKIELETKRLENADRAHGRNHEARMYTLGNLDNVLTARDKALDNAQQRHHANQKFHDDRIRNFAGMADTLRIEKGIIAQKTVDQIFKEMKMPDPDTMDLTEAQISPKIRLLDHRGVIGYEYSQLYTGVFRIRNELSRNEPYVEFLDGTKFYLPKKSEAHVVVQKELAPHVWIIDIYLDTYKLQYEDSEKSSCNVY